MSSALTLSFVVVSTLCLLPQEKPEKSPQDPPLRQEKKQNQEQKQKQRPKQKTRRKSLTLPPVIVTASRVPDDPFNLARTVTVVGQEELTRRTEASVLDALNLSIGVWVEKRTATTSDPVLRGLAGGDLLALMDGNNLTTFWGEGGDGSDDLYGKIESESIERVEVIRGPASVQYGSNSLGGVLNFITRKPHIEHPTSGIAYGGRIKSAYGTVNQLGMVRIDQELAISDFRVRVGGTWRDMNDGQGGNGVGTLDPTRGREVNVDLNGDYVLDDRNTLTFSGQSVRRRGIKRFYRPTQGNENDRTGLAVNYLFENGPDTSLETKVYYQWKEDRRDFGNGTYGRAWWQSMSVDVIGKTEVAEDHRLVGGVSVRRDVGQSPGDEEFSIQVAPGVRQKDSPDQRVYESGIFLQDDWQALSFMKVTGAIRYGYFDYASFPDADYIPKGVGSRADDRYRENQEAWTGGLGFLFDLDDEWRVSASWSRGFRFLAPTFGVVQVGAGWRVPSGLVDPVTADQYELALRYRSENFENNLVGYYTDFNGFQSDALTTFNGSTNRAGVPYVKRVADGEATLYGIEWETRTDLHHFVDVIPDGAYLGAGFMWNYGHNRSKDQPMRRTHPARGVVILGYDEPENRRYYVEANADIVGRYTRVPSDRAGDPTYLKNPQDPNSGFLRENGGKVGGLPGYTVYGLRLGYRFSEQVRCGLNIDNLTNKNYRPAHNRMDAFGFNMGVFFEAEF